VTTSYSQIMGMAEEQLSDTYYFPAYNNKTLYNQLRFANLGTASTNVRVTIGSNTYGPYTLGPQESQRVDYDLNAGPVKVSSVPVEVGDPASQPIIAALLNAWQLQGAAKPTTTSYIEMMGLPKEQLSKTYYFPSYNNKTLYNQLRFANLGAGSTHVTVKIGSNTYGPYTLGPNEEKRVDYDLNSGPVIVSSDNEKIIAAILDAWQVNGVTTSYSQLMGMPVERLTDTYVFPAYNNKTLYNQLRFANLGTGDTNVTVQIGETIYGPYLLKPNEQKRIDYPVNSGPVVVKSDGNKIIAAVLDAWQLKSPLTVAKAGGGYYKFPTGTTMSYVQLMGVPVSDTQPLSAIYYFPAYNNKTLYAQLRFGAP